MERTLNPQDWSGPRTLGHFRVDEMLEFLEISSSGPKVARCDSGTAGPYLGAQSREPLFFD